ncbi:hypothetical protein IA800_12415 [Listeria seeligeri]|uniref:hypothetical protein n=1 Tax=Listeria seeligeri TaxID=1640 RepID=UPI0016257EE6|nr:hypothetical protein [Listeria seeligeri]MBC1581032.1 hypothetical protein [Listeria seeligeri]MBC1597533.1 hypothetical protein [Listeria seeligeri]MBC1600158.1 hypothetical protein [Listeria seeligeri]MBC1810130.1 hypothetical protein [Listeria seeligeri]MBC2221771.1 hypothetical protein [Listeria seeligeri]
MTDDEMEAMKVLVIKQFLKEKEENEKNDFLYWACAFDSTRGTHEIASTLTCPSNLFIITCPPFALIFEFVLSNLLYSTLRI